MNAEQERFEAIFAATHAALLAYATRRVDDPADAADVVAETFTVAWRRLSDVPDGEAAKPWLYAVARRVLANAYRTDRRRRALTDRVRTELLCAAAARPSATDPALDEAMARLSDDDQELLRLTAWEQLEPAEIAQAMGLSAATVRVRVHRARRRLATHLEQPRPSPSDAAPADSRQARTSPSPERRYGRPRELLITGAALPVPALVPTTPAQENR